MKLSKLKLNDKNPRLIKDYKFKKLCENIQSFPEMLKLRPIIVDNNYMILGGNMRYRALKELGFKEVPDEYVKMASELTDEEVKKFILLDNNNFGEWDYDMLANLYDTEMLDMCGIDVPITSDGENNEKVKEEEIKEKEIEEMQTEHECPKCGYKW